MGEAPPLASAAALSSPRLGGGASVIPVKSASVRPATQSLTATWKRSSERSWWSVRGLNCRSRRRASSALEHHARSGVAVECFLGRLPQLPKMLVSQGQVEAIGARLSEDLV